MAFRILLADDSPFWREQICSILEDDTGWTVFQATNGAEAVQKAMWVQPDAVVLDVAMPVMDGLGAAHALRRLSPRTPVLIATVDKSAFLEVAAREAGVLRVFSKMECLELCEFLKRTFQSKAA